MCNSALFTSIATITRSKERVQVRMFPLIDDANKLGPKVHAQTGLLPVCGRGGDDFTSVDKAMHKAFLRRRLAITREAHVWLS